MPVPRDLLEDRGGVMVSVITELLNSMHMDVVRFSSGQKQWQGAVAAWLLIAKEISF